MWDSQTETLSDGRVQKFRVLRDAEPISYKDVLSLWQHDASFRTFFVGLLADSPFNAFRWETPPITRTSAERDFEFVLLRSDALDRSVDPKPFSEQLRSQAGDVLTFPNLGSDAVMVVPRDVVEQSAYGHLAAFSRNAPTSQNHELWQAVGAAMQDQLYNEPVWLSTAGMGVAWLHVRLDSRPKYYGFTPYKVER